MQTTNKFLVAYDICHPRRLRRVARLLEKHAIRCQKSVFVFTGTRTRLKSILDELADRIDTRVDLVQAWQLADREGAEGIQRGRKSVLFPEAVVLGEEVTLLIQENES